MPTAEADRRALAPDLSTAPIRRIVRKHLRDVVNAAQTARETGVTIATGHLRLVLDLLDAADAEAALRAPGESAEAMRNQIADLVEAHTYRGQGTEGRNDLIGMFARGQMRCKQALVKKIRALPSSPTTVVSDPDGAGQNASDASTYGAL